MMKIQIRLYFDSAWYFTAYSWFTDVTLAMADNWFAMGPITIPDEGAALIIGHYRGAVW